MDRRREASRKSRLVFILGAAAAMLAPAAPHAIAVEIGDDGGIGLTVSFEVEDGSVEVPIDKL